MSLTLLLPVALQQVVGLDVEDITERVGEAHVKAVDMPVRCHEAERRAPGNLVPPHQRGELVGVGRGGALPAHQFGDAHSHFQHVTNTTLSVTGVKSGTRARTVSGDTIDTKRIALHIGCTSTERAMAPRYSVQDAGFPNLRYLVWDHVRGDNLRGAELNKKNPPRHPWFTTVRAAQRVADRLNKNA